MNLSRAVDGFTLIELMLVTMIIGIVTVFALPAYQSYAIRARAVEGMALAGAAKSHVGMMLSSGNPNSDPAGYALGYTSPAATANVASVTIAPVSGIVTVTLSTAAGGGTLTLAPSADGTTALPAGTGPFVPPVGRVSWRCAAAGASAATLVAGQTAGTQPARFAPTECR